MLSHLRGMVWSFRRYARLPPPSTLALDLLRCLLDKDPGRRITLAQALAHPWMAEEPEAGDCPP